MQATTLIKLFTRDLNRLKDEILSYSNEENLWIIDKKIMNSAGNLCLHLIGNLNTYIGSELGQTGYIRNRELEFSLKNIARNELIEKIEATIEMIESILKTVSAETFETEYPLLVFDEKTSTEYFLTHLSTHLAYHLGQINYHRRLLDN